MGDLLPHALQRQTDLAAHDRNERARLVASERMADLSRVYLIAQENNPNMLYGVGLRAALVGLEAVNGEFSAFLAFLRKNHKFPEPSSQSASEKRQELEALRLRASPRPVD
ncbi:hypothetical protein T484DRAFT_1796081 [Baffinella frigidus]|nr:hypothetical protein T484DRAFT_1796081 [Cryptophyta sp. CCMP2293]